jgi:hypothetical protein
VTFVDLKRAMTVILVRNCYGLKRVSYTNSDVKVLTSNVMVFGDQAFGRYLRLDEVMS